MLVNGGPLLASEPWLADLRELPLAKLWGAVARREFDV